MIQNADKTQIYNKEQQHKITAYFEHKCIGYKSQDLDAGRLVKQTDEPFVDVKWLENCIGKHCGGCGCNMSFNIDDQFNVSSDITAQRLDNALPHYINNIIPMCVNCNCSNK